MTIIYVPFVISIILLLGCWPQEKSIVEENKSTSLVSDSLLEHAIIYEANVRQYSPEGTLNAFTKDLPEIKKLGVDIIWLMPIHPISVLKRKATSDILVKDIPDPEERKKYLGSYYAVADYKAVNPDLGTKADLDQLIKKAHDLNMLVILDWVPNHTGWDHEWIAKHPDFYTKNDKGEITDPINDDGELWGWTDVADLNYDNAEMRDSMLAQMRYWITAHDIDGFRCDVAHGIPQDFWENTIPKLREDKRLFMLAEADKPEHMHGQNLFDMAYAWEGHHIMNDLATGEKGATDWAEYLDRMDQKYEADDILMNFVTNHDENSWAGPVVDRMGKNAELLTVLSYVTKGMPLIYSGQEYDLDRKLKFFEKDTIPKTKGNTWQLLTNLAKLKKNHPALRGGKQSASQKVLDLGNRDIIGIEREYNGHKLVFLGNLSDKPVQIPAQYVAKMKNALTGKSIDVNADKHILSTHTYLLLTTK